MTVAWQPIVFILSCSNGVATGLIPPSFLSESVVDILLYLRPNLFALIDLLSVRKRERKIENEALYRPDIVKSY